MTSRPPYAGRSHRLSTLIFGFSGVGPEFCLRRGGKKMVPFEEKNGGETVSDGGGKGERRRLFLISCFCLLEGGGGGVGGSPLLRGGKEGGRGGREGHKLLVFFRRWTKEEASFSFFSPQEDEESNSLRRARADGRTVIWPLPPLCPPFLLAVRPIPSFPFPPSRLQSFLLRPSLALGNADPVPEQQ